MATTPAPHPDNGALYDLHNQLTRLLCNLEDQAHDPSYAMTLAATQLVHHARIVLLTLQPDSEQAEALLQEALRATRSQAEQGAADIRDDLERASKIV